MMSSSLPPSSPAATVDSLAPERSPYQDIRDQLATLSAGVEFHVEDHRYVLRETARECISVSSIVESFVTKFRAEEVSQSMAKRDGVPSSEILEDWRIRRDFSVVRGTEFHLYAKTFIETGRKKPLQTPIEKNVRAFHAFWDQYATRLDLVASEFILFDADLALAGTVDSLFFSKSMQKYVILDWKTNRQIRRSNGYHEKLLDPFGEWDACEYTKYSIQMSLYRMLLARALGLTVEEAFVVHFPPNGTFHVIKVEDFLPYESHLVERAKELSGRLQS